MQLDRSDRDSEQLRNRRVRARLREHRQHGTFARGELGAPLPLLEAALGLRRNVAKARPGAANGGRRDPFESRFARRTPKRPPRRRGRPLPLGFRARRRSPARAEAIGGGCGSRRPASSLARPAFDEDDVRPGARPRRRGCCSPAPSPEEGSGCLSAAMSAPIPRAPGDRCPRPKPLSRRTWRPDGATQQSHPARASPGRCRQPLFSRQAGQEKSDARPVGPK